MTLKEEMDSIGIGLFNNKKKLDEKYLIWLNIVMSYLYKIIILN